MSDPVLSIRGLERTYVTAAGSLSVLKGVDLDVQPGEIVGLIGPSGSGKSSLLHAAGLLEHPDAGQITIQGVDCSNLGERARTQVRLSTIGFVYQFHHLLPEFTWRVGQLAHARMKPCGRRYLQRIFSKQSPRVV